MGRGVPAVLRHWNEILHRVAGSARLWVTIGPARSRFMRSGLALFTLAGLAALGAVAAHALTRGDDATASYTIMTRTDAYVIETVVNGTTSLVRVPIRRVVTKDGRVVTRTGPTEVIQNEQIVVEVETRRITVTQPPVTIRDEVPVTVTESVTVRDVVTEVITIVETTTETVEGSSDR